MRDPLTAETAEATGVAERSMEQSKKGNPARVRAGDLRQNPKNPLRILALLPDAFGGHGGSARYNRHLLTALARRCGLTGRTVLLTLGRLAACEPPQTSRYLVSIARWCSPVYPNPWKGRAAQWHQLC
jgi:hypothetical protein